MKKLKLAVRDLGVTEILTREQLKKVLGGNGSEDIRCSNDRFCSIYEVRDGGCKQMETGQCRCVIYRDGVAVESVPDDYCKL